MTTRRAFLAGAAGAGLAAAGGLPAGHAAAAAPAAGTRAAGAAEPSPYVHAFYYSWYGNPDHYGSWVHWQQGGHTPPDDIGADFYPVLGAYDSGDYDGAVAQHMAWARQAGIGVLAYSWWGRGGYEDRLAAGVLDAAAAEGLQIAWHIEPYPGRDGASVVDDVAYLEETYGDHPAYHRAADRGGRCAYYVFNSLNTTDWAPIAEIRDSALVMAQTTDVSRVEHFGGIYTYDAIAGANDPDWAGVAAWCRANDYVWAPSIGPGYLDDRAVPGNTSPTVDRADGEVYDRSWGYVLDPEKGGPADWVTLTSFNEWHEGSQLEPASSTPPLPVYVTFEGAYGRTGAAAETAYLDRTRHWVTEFEAASGRS
ncbi:alpha-mannosidase [Streptomyces sp. MAR4 CNY-716]